jgi:hypothetical protein
MPVSISVATPQSIRPVEPATSSNGHILVAGIYRRVEVKYEAIWNIFELCAIQLMRSCTVGHQILYRQDSYDAGQEYERVQAADFLIIECRNKQQQRAGDGTRSYRFS